MTHKKDRAKGSTASSKREQKTSSSVVMDLLNRISSKTSGRKRDKSRHKSDRKSDRKSESPARDKTPAARSSMSRPSSMGALEAARDDRCRKTVVIRKGSQSNQMLDSGSAKRTTPGLGLSNPEIVSKTPPPRIGLRREMGDDNADLDQPRYNRGLSSPDLHHNRQLRRPQNRSCSLEVLRRSHECLKSGGMCKCTIKLYRPVSAMILGTKPELGTRPEHQTRIANGPCKGSLSSWQDAANISDLDVSSFFKPSPTIWEPKNLKNRQQLNSNLKQSETKNGNPKNTISNRVRQQNDGSGLGACARPSSVHNDASSKGVNGDKEKTKNDTRLPSQNGGITNGSSSTSMNNSRLVYSRLSRGEKRNDDRMSTSLYSGKGEWKPSNVDPVIQKQTSTTSGVPPTKPPRVWSASRADSLTARSVNDVAVADRPVTNASSARPLRHSQPFSAAMPSYTSGPQYPASTTYFCADKPGLPADRDITSYAYGSEEEKAKVLSLLDRYASNNNASLPLSREQMAAYLSCAKRQLGLDKESTDNDNDKRIANSDRAVHGEAVVNGELSDEMDVGVRNTRYNYSAKISKWNHPGTSRPEVNYERRSARRANDRIPSIVVFDANWQGEAKVRPSSAKDEERTVPMTFSRPSLVTGANRDVGVLPQTTFHVDGAITETSAIRRRPRDARTAKRPSAASDDVNNNGDVTTIARANGSPRRGLTGDCDVLSYFAIPARRLWRRKKNNSGIETSLSEILPQEEILGEQYQNIVLQLQDTIRCCRSLDTLSSWLYGSSMMIIFVFILLIGFLATFGINHVIQTSAWLSFTLAVVAMTSATFVMERRRRKVKQKLKVRLMKINSVLCDYNALCTVVDGRSCKQGTTFYFVHFDTWPCQELLASLILDKTCEDHLLTEISRKYADLFDITTQNLRDVNEEPEEIGKRVISRDVLIYFAAAFVEDFLLHKKPSTKGRQHQISGHLHNKCCLCNFVMDKVLTGAFVKDNQSTTYLNRKVKSSTTNRPTLL